MPTRQRKQVTREESEETRRAILRVAQQLFMEHGYRVISTRQIADACGLTQPALYHYFRDKEELYVAMAQEELDKTRAALERITRRGEPVEERLRHVAQYLVSATQHDHTLMLHDIRTELSPEARAVLSEGFQASFVQPIVSLFEEGIRGGLLRDPKRGGTDPVTATFLLLSMVSTMPDGERNGLFPPVSGAEYASRIVQVLLYGLAYPAHTGETSS